MITIGHSSPFARWKVTRSTASVSGAMSSVRSVAHSHSANPIDVPVGSSARYSWPSADEGFEVAAAVVGEPAASDRWPGCRRHRHRRSRRWLRGRRGGERPVSPAMARIAQPRLHLGLLEQAASAAHSARHLGRAQRFLEQRELRVGAGEDREMAPSHRGPAPIADASRHRCRFGGVGRVHGDRRDRPVALHRAPASPCRAPETPCARSAASIGSWCSSRTMVEPG